jgi:hypothetical protein
VARLLLWHGEQGGTSGAMGSVRLMPGTILDVGDVRMGWSIRRRNVRLGTSVPVFVCFHG